MLHTAQGGCEERAVCEANAIDPASLLVWLTMALALVPWLWKEISAHH